jgi:hypothetical protein
MTDGILLTISSIVLAVVSVSALGVVALRSWRDAERHRIERDAAERIGGRLRSQVRLLEVRIAALTDRVEALGSPRAAHAFGAPAGPRRHPSRQVAQGEAGRLGDPGAGGGRLAAAPNVIVFPGTAERRARR